MDKVLEGNQVEDDRLPEEFKSLKPEDALIKYEDLEFGKAIGKGAFAKVYEGKLKGQPVSCSYPLFCTAYLTSTPLGLGCHQRAEGPRKGIGKVPQC